MYTRGRILVCNVSMERTQVGNLGCILCHFELVYLEPPSLVVAMTFQYMVLINCNKCFGSRITNGVTCLKSKHYAQVGDLGWI